MPYNVDVNIDRVASTWVIVKTFVEKEPLLFEIYWIDFKNESGFLRQIVTNFYKVSVLIFLRPAK